MSKIFVFFILTSLSATSVKAMIKSTKLKKDLGDACQNIWAAAGNNLKIPGQLKVNLDNLASKPLFEVQQAGEGKLKTKVFTSFQALLKKNDENNQDKFLNLIVQQGGPVMEAFKYLKKTQVLQPSEDPNAFKKTLKYTWFKRLQGESSNGFEHVFVGKKGKKKKHYDGFHNWYQFYLEQTNGKIKIDVNQPPDLTYRTQPTFMQGLKFLWDNARKKHGSSLFVGTSPAFDFAILSTCALSLFKENNMEVCTCRIHQTDLEITAKQIFKKVKNQFKATGHINTAYPSSVVALVCTSIQLNSRTDCGWQGINPHTCGKRGCCFDSQKYDGQKNLCFYPSDHKCHGILPANRKNCGLPGINRVKCEGQGCCFDEKFVLGVPHCFEGVPKA